MQKLNTIADYFGVIGINEKFTLNRRSEANRGPEKVITGLEIYYGYYKGDLEKLDKENEQWINLDGTKTVWLKMLYNQKSLAITNIEFLYLPIEGKRLKIHTSYSYIPVPVKRLGEEKSEHKIEANDEIFTYYTGAYDLTTILECESKKNYHLVLCYKIQNKNNYDPPIENIILVVANLKKDTAMNSYKYQAHVPKGYQSVNYGVGRREKNRILAFKKKKPIASHAFSPEILDRYPAEDHQDNPFSLAVPLFCFPKGITLSRILREPISFSFILTQQDGIRIYGTCLNFDEPFPMNLIDQLGHIEITKEKPLFIQKSIVIISRYPFFTEFKEILKQIYRVHLSKSDLPIERIICNFIDEVPLPDKGKVGVLYQLGKPILFKRPENYPIISDESIKNLFTALSLHNIINLLEFVLLERKIYLISQHPSLLTQVAEAMTGLIFPFIWSHVLIPILPDEMREFIHAPVPFIIGCNSKGEELNYTTPEAVKVYLDSDEMIFSDNIPPLPEAGIKILTKRLQSFSHLHANSKAKLQIVDCAFSMNLVDLDDEKTKFDPYEIRDAFFEFICSLLKYYPKFFKPPVQKSNEMINFTDVFATKEFLAINKANKQGTFLSKLVETALFSYFIETRCMESQFDAEYQLLDSAITGKKNKKDGGAIKPITLTKTFHCYPPNTTNLQPGKIYQYVTFPRLNKELFIKPRAIERVCIDKLKPIKICPPEELNTMDDLKWAKFLLENIYFIWFFIFITKLKQNYDEIYNKLTDYAYFLLDDMMTKGLVPNDLIYQYLIEACAYCGMTDRALELATKMHAARPEGNPSAHGIYLEAIAKSKNNKVLKEKQQLIMKRMANIEIMNTQNAETLKPDEIQSGISSQTNIPIPSTVLPFANFILMDQCPKCSKFIYTEEIIGGWKRSYNHYVTKCHNAKCQNEFVANFKVIQYKPDCIEKDIPVPFLSPLLVRKEIENIIKSDGEEGLFKDNFEEKHQSIYWNCYFYSNLIKAPTFFFERPFSKELTQNMLYQFEQSLIQRYSRPTLVTTAVTTGSIRTQIRDYLNTRMSLSKSPTPFGRNNTITGTGGNNTNVANAKIKKIFGELITELKTNLERKLNELEHEKANHIEKYDSSGMGADAEITTIKQKPKIAAQELIQMQGCIKVIQFKIG